MKLIIQIPCLNEEGSLPRTLAALPREVEGFDAVEWLIVDDGSIDRTAAVARACAVDHVVRLSANQGLAAAFQAGLDACLKLGADVIVNTDADGQYRGEDVPRLVAPILARRADLVIGDRGVVSHDGFSPLKRALQSWGSRIVQGASAAQVPDATSGFRAYSRAAALRVNVVSRFTYTLESVIQAGRGELTVGHVSIGTNPVTRPSRLFRSNFEYVRRSLNTLLRLSAAHWPIRFFGLAAAPFALVGLVLLMRFVWLYFTIPGPTGHVQSLVVGAVSLLMALQLGMLGVIADLLRTNRIIAERTLRRVRALELVAGVEAEGLVPPAAVGEDAPAEQR